MVDEPNCEGELEIGYGTYDVFQGKGFMTEMVGGIIEWAKTQAAVKSIVATTNKTNAASFKVLERNSFVKVGETDVEFHWKLKLDTVES
jgi:RimJ/RimL family protein N-acetyltransferase